MIRAIKYLVLMLWTCSFLWAGGAAATNITINDLTETVTVTSDGNPAAITILPDSSGEFLHFTFLSSRVNTVGTATFVAFLFEGIGRAAALSDVFVITATSGSALLDIMFYSDPATFPVGLQPNATFVENGSPQQLVQYFGGSTTPIDTYFVASDVERLPEPATLALLGIGLGGIWFSRSRKAQRAR